MEKIFLRKFYLKITFLKINDPTSTKGEPPVGSKFGHLEFFMKSVENLHEEFEVPEFATHRRRPLLLLFSQGRKGGIDQDVFHRN